MAQRPRAREGAGGGRGVRGGRWVFLAWTATFLAFPPSGLVARELLGPVDGLGPALGGGLLVGLGVGAAQWLVLRARLAGAALWIPATGLGLALGLAAGSSLVGYDTELADLALQGALSGLGGGCASGARAASRDARSACVDARLRTPVGARLGGHHPRRHRRRAPVHELRRLRSARILAVLGRVARVASGRPRPHDARAGLTVVAEERELHVGFGSGPVGRAVAAELVRGARRVRILNRSGRAPGLDEVEIVGGDACGPTFAAVMNGDRRAPRGLAHRFARRRALPAP